MTEPAAILEVAERAARAGAEILTARFRDTTLESELKAEHDYVSQADRDSEAAILEVVRGAFSDHEILAEESGRVGHCLDDLGPGLVLGLCFRVH